MHEAVMQRVEGCDLFVSAAAVADYRPAAPHPEKLKKQDERMTLELVRNPRYPRRGGVTPRGAVYGRIRCGDA
jgi:phosphopantothenoylcysteine synthetase/decarboxylase